jgi:hypothetical protein
MYIEKRLLAVVRQMGLPASLNKPVWSVTGLHEESSDLTIL